MGPVRRDRRDQAVQLIPLLLQLLHKTLYGTFAKALGFAALPAISNKNIFDDKKNREIPRNKT